MARALYSGVFPTEGWGVFFRGSRGLGWSLPAVLALLFALWTVTPWGSSLEQRLGLEMLFRLRGERVPPPGVMVLAITRESARQLGLPDKLYLWSRDVHAQAVERLHVLGARLVVFDIFFEQERDAAGDRAFADALRRAGNVLLFARAERQPLDLGDGLLVDQQLILEPLSLLREAARSTGPLILPKIPARVDRFLLRHPAFPARLTLHTQALQQVQPEAPVLADPPVSLPYNYYGPPHSIPTRDYAQLLQNPDAMAALVRDAVVFVGYSAAYQHDQRDGFYTAFTADSGLDISGVELAATAFANLRDDSWLRELPVLLQLLLVWLYGWLAFAVARRLAPVVAAGALGGLALVAGLLALWSFSAHCLWLPWFNGVLVLTPLAGTIGIWLRSRELHVQKVRLQQAFGRYLPADEIHRLLAQQEFPASQDLHHSVCLVTDAQGYSRLSEQLTPVELARLMQDYYSAVIGAIRAGKGLISDVAGDGIIALWPHLDQARAWSTLQPVIDAIQQAVEAFNQRHPRHSLPTRIGVHAGHIVLGHFGALDHFEFRAMGDIVNTASRLEGANKSLGTGVLISEACVARPEPNLLDLGRFRFAGKDIPLRLYTPAEKIPAPLCAAFSTALTQLQQGKCEEAVAGFRAISAQYPAHGPSRFFADTLADTGLPEDARASLAAGIVPLMQK